MLVPKVKTPIGPLELAAVLRDAHANVLEKDINVDRLGCAWAQMAFEHGHGDYVYCHNIGNVTAFGSWAGDHYEIRFTRKENPHDAPDGDAAEFVMRFRAHEDFIDGARDYWRVINGRYRSVLPIFDQGLPVPAAQRLHELGYFTAPVSPYATGMASLYQEFQRKILPRL